MTLDQALAYVRSKRPIIQPNDGFLKQLRLFEEQLHQSAAGLPASAQSTSAPPLAAAVAAGSLTSLGDMLAYRSAVQSIASSGSDTVSPASSAVSRSQPAVEERVSINLVSRPAVSGLSSRTLPGDRGVRVSDTIVIEVGPGGAADISRSSTLSSAQPGATAHPIAGTSLLSDPSRTSSASMGAATASSVSKKQRSDGDTLD